MDSAPAGGKGRRTSANTVSAPVAAIAAATHRGRPSCITSAHLAAAPMHAHRIVASATCFPFAATGLSGNESSLSSTISGGATTQGKPSAIAAAAIPVVTGMRIIHRRASSRPVQFQCVCGSSSRIPARSRSACPAESSTVITQTATGQTHDCSPIRIGRMQADRIGKSVACTTSSAPAAPRNATPVLIAVGAGRQREIMIPHTAQSVISTGISHRCTRQGIFGAIHIPVSRARISGNRIAGSCICSLTKTMPVRNRTASADLISVLECKIEPSSLS